MKDEREFYPSSAVEWADAGGGVSERVLSRGADGMLTRLARWAPGTTTDAGVIRHEYVEEVYLLEGELTDLTLQRTFRPGDYACRPPGMPHGPYTTTTGCTMLEIRYRAAPPADAD